MEIFDHINVSMWILQTLAMMLTALLLPGFTVSGPIGALIGVVGIAFVNAQIWDAALFFSIPDTVSFHALTVLIANGIIFWLVVKILPGIDVVGLFPSILAPVIFTVSSLFLNAYAKEIDWENIGRTSLAYIQDVRNDLLRGEERDSRPKQ